MIKEDIYDHDFVDAWCYGFEQLAETVEPYTLERIEEITWVPAWKIEKCARMMAEADGWIMQWGVATDMCKEAIPSCQALSALFQITGDVDVPGGMISPPSILTYYNGWGGENLPPEQEEKRLGIHKYPLYKYGFKNASTDVTIAAIETGKDENGNDYPCKAAWPRATGYGLRTTAAVPSARCSSTPSTPPASPRASASATARAPCCRPPSSSSRASCRSRRPSSI